MKSLSPKCRSPGAGSSEERHIQGFSLLELIAILVLLSVLSVSAIAFFSGAEHFRLEGAARKIASDIRYAQELAMETHGTYTLEFDVANDRYTLSAKNVIGTLSTDPFTQQDFTVQLNAGDYTGVTLESADWGGNPDFSFDWEGKPSAPGTIMIACGGTSVLISIVDETGLVQLPSFATLE